VTEVVEYPMEGAIGLSAEGGCAVTSVAALPQPTSEKAHGLAADGIWLRPARGAGAYCRSGAVRTTGGCRRLAGRVRVSAQPISGGSECGMSA